MIASQKGRTKRRSFRELSSYILDLKSKGEKVLHSWASNCTFDELDLATIEIENTQKRNTRSESSKTYHLVASLADGEHLTLEQYRDVENVLCKAIGLEGNQRICAVHRDTENEHIHLAISKVDPRTLNNISPFNDHHKLLEACRQLEKTYNLKLGRNLQNEMFHHRKSEIFRGVEAFDTWVKETVSEDLLRIIQEKQTSHAAAINRWQQVHNLLQENGLKMEIKGSDIVIENREDGRRIKATRIDKALSAENIQSLLGPIETPNFQTVAKKKYDPRSLKKQELDLSPQNYKKAQRQLKSMQSKAVEDYHKNIELNLAAIKDRFARLEQTITDSRNLAENSKDRMIKICREDCKIKENEFKSSERLQLAKLKASFEMPSYDEWRINNSPKHAHEISAPKVDLDHYKALAAKAENKKELFDAYHSERGALRDLKQYLKDFGFEAQSSKTKDIGRIYSEIRIEIIRDAMIPDGEKQHRIRKLNMQEAQDKKSNAHKIRTSTKTNLDSVKIRTWDEWLRNQAEDRNLIALDVLRSRKMNASPTCDLAIVSKVYQARIFQGIPSKVDAYGGITYHVGKGRIRDTGRSIEILSSEPETIKAAITVAKEIYGNGLEVRSSDQELKRLIQQNLESNEGKTQTKEIRKNELDI
ncbi:MAG: hypothetical protein EOP04_02510 [Proteobacteria bacterium]|nr:MAG: hypothetical protein EOP04_02510 [Pseudomonadota bacterium]